MENIGDMHQRSDVTAYGTFLILTQHFTSLFSSNPRIQDARTAATEAGWLSARHVPVLYCFPARAAPPSRSSPPERLPLNDSTSVRDRLPSAYRSPG